VAGPFAGRTGWAPAHDAGRIMLSRTVPTLAWLDIRGHRMTEPSTSWQPDDITYSGGTRDGPRANVRLSRAEQEVHAEGAGTGLIDAVCQSVSRATGVEARVVAFRAYSVGPGQRGGRRGRARGGAAGPQGCGPGVVHRCREGSRACPRRGPQPVRREAAGTGLSPARYRRSGDPERRRALFPAPRCGG
jgi:hypothetical protein